jgi:glycosyltransferase involved in cell wall biosynthesis
MTRQRKKLHIVGIHGVPANYGGFETLADFLCQYLQDTYEITVYCNANKYVEKPDTYFGAKLKYIPLDASGARGIIFDAIAYCRACWSADVILYLSPVGSGLFTPLKYLFGKKVIMNHGGLNEWEREKLSWPEKKWAKFNHRVAARFSDINIADNELYRKSLKDNFGADSEVIRYGGDHVKKIPKSDKDLLAKYPFVDKNYAVSVSRAQIDNNLHMVLEAFEDFRQYPLVLIANWNVSKYGKDLFRKYKDAENIIVLDAIYDKVELDFVRGNAHVYIHSHSRCGTAPSLVEAMSLSKAIVSFDAPTNRETTQNKAVYFSDSSELIDVLNSTTDEDLEHNRAEMLSIASTAYTWAEISEQYRKLVG